MDIVYEGRQRVGRNMMSAYWLDSVDSDWMNICKKNIESVIQYTWATTANQEEFIQHCESKIVQYYIKQKRKDINDWLAENKIGFMGKLGSGTLHYPYAILLLLDTGSEAELAFKLKYKIKVESQ